MFEYYGRMIPSMIMPNCETVFVLTQKRRKMLNCRDCRERTSKEREFSKQQYKGFLNSTPFRDWHVFMWQ